MRVSIHPRRLFSGSGQMILCSSLFLFATFLLYSCNDHAAKSVPGDPQELAAPKPKGPTNKDIYDIFNSGNYSRLDSIVAKDAIDHNPWGTTIGVDSMKASFVAVKTAFPDMKVEVLDEVVQGDMVMTRCRTTGTNTGSMEGRPVTGKKIDFTGVDVTRLKDGKLYEHWDYSDYVTYFKQLGIDPFAATPAKKKGEK